LHRYPFYHFILTFTFYFKVKIFINLLAKAYPVACALQYSTLVGLVGLAFGLAKPLVGRPQAKPLVVITSRVGW